MIYFKEISILVYMLIKPYYLKMSKYLKIWCACLFNNILLIIYMPYNA